MPLVRKDGLAVTSAWIFCIIKALVLACDGAAVAGGLALAGMLGAAVGAES